MTGTQLSCGLGFAEDHRLTSPHSVDVFEANPLTCTLSLHLSQTKICAVALEDSLAYTSPPLPQCRILDYGGYLKRVYWICISITCPVPSRHTNGHTTE